MTKRSRLFKTRVPNVMFGTLLLLAMYGLTAPASVTYLSDIHSPPQLSLSLAREYCIESDWQACRVEAMRALKESPDEETASLLKAIAETKLGLPQGESGLRTLAEGDASSSAVSAAQYELGRLLAQRGDLAHAFPLLATVFQKSPSKELYLRAGCTLWSVALSKPELAETSPGLLMQLRTSSVLWTRQLRQECSLEPRKRSLPLTSIPLRWIVSLYRKQISPAIGMRCSCYPSCSEFGRQSFTRFGILGLALYGARAIREPDVVAEQREIIHINGRRLYYDPVDNYIWRGPRPRTTDHRLRAARMVRLPDQGALNLEP